MSKFPDDNNPYVKRLEQLEQARKLWGESEWILNFLRTIPATPTKAPTDDEMLIWQQKNTQGLN